MRRPSSAAKQTAALLEAALHHQRAIFSSKARQLVNEVLADIDLIYSMGLFDYLEQPLAQKTARRLFKMLSPGGRLLIGNLCRVPDSTWILEYGLAWHLIYRNHDEMIDMGARINSNEGAVQVASDSTGHCLFLDARRDDD